MGFLAKGERLSRNLPISLRSLSEIAVNFKPMPKPGLL
jgi:hypothetical protein